MVDSVPINLTRPFVSAILTALMLVCSAQTLANGVDKQVEALVQGLRDLPGYVPAGTCTPCNEGSQVGAERRDEIYGQLNALGSAAVPTLARMLRRSLQGPDKDLTATILLVLNRVRGPYTSRDGKEHEKNDISAALPVLMVALDDPNPNTRATAASTIGVMGPKGAQAVPKLVAMLDDKGMQVPLFACGGLQGIDPLPALRQARSDPNPDKRQFAQHAIASIETKCNWTHERPSPLEELARTADVICKATVIAQRPVSDDSFKPIDGYEVREAQLRVVSTVKGVASNVIRFRYYAQSYGLFNHELPSDADSLATGRTYLVAAKQDAGDRYREVASFLPSSRRGFYVGPPPPDFGMVSPGVLLAADAMPHRGATLTEAAWSELLALLKSPDEDDAVGAIQQLDRLSGGPSWNRRRAIFERDEALVAIQPLVEAKSVVIATAAITVFGEDSPYFNDQDAAFWLAGIGKGHISGLYPRKRPENPVVAEMGATELLQVANDGPTPEVRALAIRALGRGRGAYPPGMVAMWARDPSAEVHRAAVLASGDVPNHEPIVTASTDGSSELRHTAALAVGFAQDPHLLPVLDRLLHDPVAEVRGAAALGLLSYPVDQAAPVLKANLTSDFRPLFINALASRDPQPYVPMLAEVIEQAHGKESAFQETRTCTCWGTIPDADSWRILFDYLKSRPTAELTSGKLDSSLHTLERMHWYSSGEPTALYELYVSRGLVSRAKEFRNTARASAPDFNLDVYFDRIDTTFADHQ